MRPKGIEGALSPEHWWFGRAVRGLRYAREYSQEVLGHDAGLHRNYVGAIERGEINPTLRTMLMLTRGLKVSLSELIAAYEARRELDALAQD